MAPESRIGTQIAGYRIEALIGQGGMGEVYLAEHETLGRMEAVKVLSADLSTDEGFRKRFQREARLAASLRHPNIIPVYSAGESNGSLYLVMPYIRGTDLRRLIDERKQLDPEQTLRILDGIASALDAAHGEGLVHRDVKPANILIEARDGHVYLTDFGVTRHMDSKTQLTPTGRFMGTLHYVAPEQIEGKSVDARTDVYSLGCVLYECLAGAVPYQRDSEGSLLWAHLSEAPPRLTDRRPDLPREIDLVIARAMAKRKEDRYEACTELIQAARVALGETGEAAAPVSRPPQITQEGDTLGPPAVTGAPVAQVAPASADATFDRESVAPAAASLQTELGDSGSGETVAAPTDGGELVSPAAAASATGAGTVLEEPAVAGESTDQGPRIITAPTDAPPVGAAAAATGSAEMETSVAPSAEMETAVRPSAEMETVARPPEDGGGPSVATAAAAAAGAAAAATGAAVGAAATLAGPAEQETAAAPPEERTVAAGDGAKTVADPAGTVAAASAGTVAAAPAPPAGALGTVPVPAPPVGFTPASATPTMAGEATTVPQPQTIAEPVRIGPPGGPPPSRPGSRRLLLILVGAVVIVGAIVAVVLAAGGGGGGGTTTPPPQPPTSVKPGAAPVAPAGLTVKASGGTKAVLAWSDKSSDEDGFQIFEGDTVVATTAANATTFTIESLAPGSKHCYQVAAVRSDTLSDKTTPPVCVTLPNLPGPPASPTSVKATAIDQTHIKVSWKDASSDLTGFRVIEKNKIVKTIGADHRSVVIGGLGPDSTHCYQVAAVNQAGVSDRSKADCATTLKPTPITTTPPPTGGPTNPPPTTQPPSNPPPSSVSITSVSCGATSCSVSWSGGSGATSFTVSGSNGAGSRSVSGSSHSTSFSGLQPGQTYCFTVTASNSAGSTSSSQKCGSTSG